MAGGGSIRLGLTQHTLSLQSERITRDERSEASASASNGRGQRYIHLRLIACVLAFNRMHVCFNDQRELTQVARR